MISVPVYAAHTLGGFTANAGTVIQAVIPPAPPQRILLRTSKRHFVRIASLCYVSGATQHTVTILRPQGYTTLSAGAAAAQAVINLTADPAAASTMLGPSGAATKIAANAIAANDLLVVECPDGTYHLGKVSSVATLAITLTANVPTGGFTSGARVWSFGVTGDSDPFTGLAHPYLVPTVSARTVYSDTFTGIACSNNPYEPMIINSSNGTNAGTIEYVTAIYTDR